MTDPSPELLAWLEATHPGNAKVVELARTRPDYRASFEKQMGATGPSPPAPPSAANLPRNPYRAQMAAVQGCIYGEAPSCGCASKRKCWKVGKVVPLRDCYECIPLGKK